MNKLTVTSPYRYDLYPEQLRDIAALCEALNAVDNSNPVMRLGDIPVNDEAGVRVGWLVDEVGGAWAFRYDTPEESDR